MDATLYDRIQRDEAVADDANAAQNAAMEAQAIALNVCLPGIIVTFDADLQTAVVQPAIQTIFRGTGPVDLPRLVDVPVSFCGCRDFILTFPVKPGDECILIFSDRAIDFWWQNGAGGTVDNPTGQLPAEYRTHDFSDAFALVGVNSKPHKIPAFSTSDVQLRSRDGSAFVSINPIGTIHLTASPPSADVITTAGTVSGNITETSGVASGNIVETSGATGQIKMNSVVPGTAPGNPQLEGVVLACDPCPILGLQLYQLACGSQRVLAGKL